MSLINDVLRDLDKSNADDRAQRDIPPGLMAAGRSAGHRTKIWWWLVLLVLLVAVAVFGWMSLQRGTHLTADFQNGLTDNQKNTDPIPVEAIATPAANSPPASSSESEEAGKALAGRESQAQPQVGQTQKAINDIPIARAPSAQQESIVGEITPAQVQTLKAKTEQTPGPSEEMSTEIRGKASLSVTQSLVTQSSVTQSSVANEEAGPGRTLIKTSPSEPASNLAVTPSSVSRSSDTTKTPIKTAPVKAKPVKAASVQADMIVSLQTSQGSIQPSQNPEALALRTLRDARALYQQGRARDAELMLSQQLSQRPELNQSRQQLASWQLARGGVQEALGLLAGVNQNSAVGLKEAKAHALVASGQAEQAIQLLSANSPEVKQHLSYHGLLAGLLQQAGRYEDALQVYALLVEMVPTRGDWWVGLGIALDQTGRVEPAMRAYRQALTDPTLSQALNQYAKQRFDQLDDFLGAQPQTGRARVDG